MPGVKEKCICQICVCGQHHCGRDENGYHPQQYQQQQQRKEFLNQCPTKLNDSIELPVIVETTREQESSPPIDFNKDDDRFLEQQQEYCENSDFIKISDTEQQQYYYPNNNKLIIKTFKSEKGHLKQPTESKSTVTNEKIIKINTEQDQYLKFGQRQNIYSTPPPQAPLSPLQQMLEESEMKQKQPETINETEQQQQQTNKSNGIVYVDHSQLDVGETTSFPQQQQRKTWETSPEHVEELTRSLSRMRNDEQGNRIVSYEKAKCKTTTANTGTIPSAATSKNIGKTNNNIMKPVSKKNNKMTTHTTNTKNYSMPTRKIQNTNAGTLVMAAPNRNQKMVTNNNNGGHQQQQQQQQQQKPAGFLPPLTGFSDSDSSFSSIVCTSEDCDKIHCICETLKKTHLEERHELSDQEIDEHLRLMHSENGINFIDMDNEKNWIVQRPKRVKPRDNLKLEGSMEMQTTNRSTYGGLTNYNPNDPSLMMKYTAGKRSTSTRSSGQKFIISPNHHHYLNTRRGRYSGGRSGQTPLLRSARRKFNRNRPKTSLKLGGHGYWSTNNRDAYKNFIIINGEAKTIANGDGEMVKLPKVVTTGGTKTKTTMMTSEEKNRCKYDASILNDDGDSNDQINDGMAKPMRLVDNKEIRKFEKKSFVTTKEGNLDEFTGEKLMKKTRSNVKSKHRHYNANANGNDQLEREDSPQQDNNNLNKQQSDSRNIARPYDIYQIDHIKDLGLLEIKSQLDEQEEMERKQLAMAMNDDHNQQKNYRQHLRRLHETSDDFNILTGGDGSNLKRTTQTDTNNNIKQSTKLNDINKSSTNQQPLVVNGHAVMAASRKPFPLPQKQQPLRHKNDSSINMFEGEMEFTTTSKSSYRNGRIEQQPRKRTAGRRSQRSGRKRNLFRQSSDSIFARPDSASSNKNNQQPEQQQQRQHQSEPLEMIKQNQRRNLAMGVGDNFNYKKQCSTIYKSEFGDDSLHCPVLDLNENFKMTAKTGGHKYFNQIDKI